MISKVDIVFGLAWGDEGKGKITSNMIQNYDYVCRWNGGPNAGHTIYLNDKKFKTHIIPCGLFQGKKSIIGPNCVINIDKFYEEIEYLKNEGFDTSLVKISPKANIITRKHIEYDVSFLKDRLGTTGQGIAPCYSDKMLRCGILAKDKIDKKFLWDEELRGNVLCEGAQSFWLDINQGDYPFVTSSETLPYSACSLGFSPKVIKNITGVAKIYDTKSGVDPLFPESLRGDEVLNKIIEEGQEYGSTTGRKRYVNWLRIDKLVKAINISGSNNIIINKYDVLLKIGVYKIIEDNKTIEFKTFDDMKNYIGDYIKQHCPYVVYILFSGHKEKI